jgi:serine/threonine protein kinase
MSRLRKRSLESAKGGGLSEISPKEEAEANAAAEQRLKRKKKASPGGSISGEKKKLKFDLGVVDVSDAIEQEARERAEAALTEENETAATGRIDKVRKWFGKKFKSVWKGNLFREYYRQKEIVKAKSDIRESGNLYGGAADQEAHDKAMDSIVERFVNDYDQDIKDELIHEGEKIGELRESEMFQEIQGDLNLLVKAFAGGSISEDQFRTMKRNIFSRVKSEHDRQVDDESIADRDYDSVFGDGQLYADNLLEIAKQIKGMAEHGQSLEDLDIEFDITVGRAKAGVRTEMQVSAVDRMTEKLTDSKLGGWLKGAMGVATTETVIASTLSAAYSVASVTSQSFARSKLATFGSFGATAFLAGGVAAYRERKQLDRERRLHTRERAKNLDFKMGDDERREEMESFIYETRSASDLASEIEIILSSEGGLTPEAHEQLARLASDADARVQISDREQIDLLSYSSGTDLEGERLRLDIMRARAKVEMRKHMETENPEADWNQLYNDIVERRSGMLSGENGSERAQKDKLYNAMSRKKTAGAFVKGVAVGVAIGIGMQETIAAFSDKQYGIVDAIRGKKPVIGEHFTGLEYLKKWATGDLPVSPGTHTDIIGGAKFELPDGVSLDAQPDGTFTLTADGEPLVAGLQVDSAGSLTGASEDLLAKNGIGISTDNVHTQVTSWRAGSMDADTYIQDHPGDMTEVSRDLWYGNDTPMYTDPLSGKLLGADHNELRLLWGGAGQSGLDSAGNYVFDVSEMAKDGSWQGIASADAQRLLAEGKLKMMLSFSAATQNHVFEVPIGIDGQAIIDPMSPAGRFLFDDVGGKAKFLGKFAEVVQDMGTDDAGVDHVRMLATHIGNGVDHIVGEVPVVTEGLEVITSLDIPSSVDILPPPVIPIWGRRFMERMKPGLEPIPYYMGGEKLSKEKEKMFIDRRSPNLIENPNATLDPIEEAKRYLETLSQSDRDWAESLAKQLGPMGKETRISVCIPVAGHQEEKNIYRSLENYTFQTIGKKKFEIVLFVNHPDVDPSGKDVEPDGTLKEIERFMNDYPDMPVKVMYNKIPTKQAKIGKVRKLLSDSVLMRQVERGVNEDILMVSNDADNFGIAPEYLDNFVQRFDENPELDGLLGQLDWDPGSYVDNPLSHIGTRLFQYISVIGRHRSGGLVSSGANFAYKGSIYAGIGGYISELPGGEDVAVGQAIAAARGTRDRVKFAGARVSRLYTSSRRADHAVKQGLSPVEQWDKGFSAFDDEVRKNEQVVGVKPDYNDPEYMKKLKSGLESVLNRTLEVFARGEGHGKDAMIYKKAMGWLGIKYRVEGNGIVITDMSKLVSGLSRYQEDGVLMRDAKSGKNSAAEKLREQRMRRDRESAEAKLAQQKIDTRQKMEVLDSYSGLLTAGGLKLNVDDNIEPFEAALNADDADLNDIGEYKFDKSNAFLSWSDVTQVYPGKNASGERVVVKQSPVEARVVQSSGVAKGRTVEEYLFERKFQSDVLVLPELSLRSDDGKLETRIYKDGGEDLETRFKKQNTYKVDEALKVMIQIGRGLIDLHAIGVVHADVAPSNILIDSSGAKLADLDDAHMKAASGYYSDNKNSRLKKNRFIHPPETMRKPAVFKENIDVYQSGATLYRLLVGEWPYSIPEMEGDDVDPEERLLAYRDLHETGNITFPDTVPKAVQDIVKKSMDPDPNRRYQHAYEFVKDMIDVLSGKSINSASNVSADSTDADSKGATVPLPKSTKASATVPRPNVAGTAKKAAKQQTQGAGT